MMESKEAVLFLRNFRDEGKNELKYVWYKTHFFSLLFSNRFSIFFHFFLNLPQFKRVLPAILRKLEFYFFC